MKRYIFAMSTERNKAINDMQRLSSRISEHLIKCSVYGDTLSCYNHWVEDELATWISFVNDITCKPNNKKLKMHDYQSNLFSELGDDFPEARLSIHLWLEDNKETNQYPEINSDVIQSSILKYQQVSVKCLTSISKMLSIKNDMTKKDWEVYLHEILDPICK